MPKIKKLNMFVLIAVFAFCTPYEISASQSNQQKEITENNGLFGDLFSEDAEWIDEKLLPIEAGPLDIGGAVRFNYSYRSWQHEREEGGEFDLDTIRTNIDLQNTEPWIGSLEYRYYRTRGADSYNMLHHGWVGYMFNDEEQIQVGVQQVPFGILPYASHNWFFQLPYYVGLEDDYDLGFKYIKNVQPWNFQFAYYPGSEGDWNGHSKDSARYSYDVVETDGTNSSANKEKHQFNARAAYTFKHSDQDRTEIGISTQYGLIPNSDTDQTGDHYALGLHLDGYYGPWNAKLEAIRYDYNLDNPAGMSDSYVNMGAYDSPYRVAASGTLLCAGISREVPVNWGPIEKVTFYNDYSILLKDPSSYPNSQQNVLGMSIQAGRWFTYIDLAIGQRQPWMGGTWTDALADGGEADAWRTRFNVNVGYYF
jgi:hypothetical protein